MFGSMMRKDDGGFRGSASHRKRSKIGELDDDGGQGPSAGLTREPLVDDVWVMGDCQGGEEHLPPDLSERDARAEGS
jgi:hypothetical protein